MVLILGVFALGLPVFAGREGEGQEGLFAKCQSWSNTEGRVFEAAIVTVENNVVLFRMKNGKEVVYPLKKLSSKSQKKINHLRSA